MLARRAQVLVTAVLLLLGPLAAVAQSPPFGPTECEGDYSHHLQGVCTDRESTIFWSFTTELVKTDAAGKVLLRQPADNHHGDLCYLDGKVYVAVNLGKFNQPAGLADSWVYVYDAGTLDLLAKHPVPEVVHGAGGMDSRDGHFYIIGGLPEGVEENYIYEYDASFRFVKRHVLSSGWTKLGIQTALWHDGAWWFGCYGSPAILLVADADFKLLGRYESNASLGLIGIDQDHFLVARGPRTAEKRHRGVLVSARRDPVKGLLTTGP